MRSSCSPRTISPTKSCRRPTADMSHRSSSSSWNDLPASIIACAFRFIAVGFSEPHTGFSEPLLRHPREVHVKTKISNGGFAIKKNPPKTHPQKTKISTVGFWNKKPKINHTKNSRTQFTGSRESSPGNRKPKHDSKQNAPGGPRQPRQNCMSQISQRKSTPKPIIT